MGLQWLRSDLNARIQKKTIAELPFILALSVASSQIQQCNILAYQTDGFLSSYIDWCY